MNKGLLLDIDLKNLPINTNGNLYNPDLASNVRGILSEPVDMNAQVGMTGQSLGDVVGFPAIETIPEGVPADGMQMPSMQTLEGAFGDLTSTGMPMAESPQARATGYKEAVQEQVNPYMSAAASKGLLEMLQKAYSLGA